MRRAVIAVIILAILFVGTYASQRYSKKAVDSMVQSLNTVQTTYERNGSLPETKRALDDFSGQWEKNLRFFSMVIRENHIDEVRFSLAEARKYLEYNDKVEFMSELEFLKENIQSIYRCDEMLVDNIF
jgi:hypothetical protein